MWVRTSPACSPLTTRFQSGQQPHPQPSFPEFFCLLSSEGVQESTRLQEHLPLLGLVEVSNWSFHCSKALKHSCQIISFHFHIGEAKAMTEMSTLLLLELLINVTSNIMCLMSVSDHFWCLCTCVSVPTGV